MAIQLPSDIASFLHDQVESGAFATTDDALRAAVALLKNDAARTQERTRLRELLQPAVDQADRGEVVDVDEAFDEVETELFGKNGVNR
jgi:Arc/MetJ-type ribon-helix-helix transcriptional regulator